MTRANAFGKEIEDYLLFLAKNKKYSEAALHTTVNALDRQGILSPVLLQVLRDYYKKYNPKLYLFEGQSGACTAFAH